VVRVARSEPPLAIAPYGWDPSAAFDRSLRIGADDVIEGWLGANASGAGPIAVTIDAAGHPRSWPAPPRLGPIFPAGRLALARADDGQLWETVDAGHHWALAEPPPALGDTTVASCSPVGCRVGPFLRLGWSASAPASPVSFDPAQAIAQRERGRPPRAPSPAVLRLACTFEGAPETRRLADSGGFGVPPTAQPRGGVPLRIGTLGVASVTWSGPQATLTGDVEVGWVAPFDLDGRVRRATVPAAQLEAGSRARRPQEMHLGWLLAPDGHLDTFATGDEDHCPARFLSRLGIARGLGGCAGEPAVGVELGGRVLVIHAASDQLVLSVATAMPMAAPAARARRVGPERAGDPAAALRELGRSPVGAALRAFAFGAGVRAGAPVAVGVDRSGEAALVSVDPARGTLGPEERLRPLAEARLGSDPGCVPRPDDARVVLPFEGLIGVDRGGLRGLAPGHGAGVAVIRWSRDRACLDAVEVPVHDERFEEGPGNYEPPGTVRKLMVRAGARGEARGLLLAVSPGAEVRQRVVCSGVKADRGGD
jgi:hypothetical protein